jgi:hypothetical protein
MDPTTVYAKTPLGADEISTRARHLPGRVRAMLIMVDGRRSVADLVGNHPSPDDARSQLQVLVDGGFIAPLEASVLSTPFDLVEARHTTMSALIDVLGPDADVFAGGIENAVSREALVAECERLARVVEGAAGRPRAERFRSSVSAVLG